MRIELTPEQATEAVKLVRVLASFECENEDADTGCADLDREPHEMCGPCQATSFVTAFDGGRS